MENIKCGNGITREIPQNEKEQPMKIGDEVYVHGYIDEIRQDIIIIRNNGGYFGTFSSEVVKQEPCEDLISRQNTLDALYDKGLSMTAWGELLAMKWSDIQKCIEQLPSTQPERKKGKWIIDYKETGRIWHCHCSNCGKDPQDHIGGTENWWLVRLPKYCPNCGLPMRGDEE